MKQQVVYWIATGLVSLMMSFSVYAYFTDANVGAGFAHLGFPDYFRVQLGVAKLIGVVLLLAPFVPRWAKEWAYAGFGITFVSAAIAHVVSGDPTPMVVGPLVALALLTVSYVSLRRLKSGPAVAVSPAA